MNKTLTLLVTSILSEENGIVKEIAPGIFVFYRDRPNHNSLISFYVVWDPALWRLAKENPKSCFLRVDFKYLSSDQPMGNDLISFLKNTLEPLSEEGVFHPHQLRVQLGIDGSVIPLPGN